MAGTFIVKPTSLSSGGIPLIDGNGAIPSDYAGWLINFPSTIMNAVNGLDDTAFFQAHAFADTVGVTFNDTLRFACGGASIYLDGSLVGIDAGSLPSGFTALSAQVVITQVDRAPSGGTANYYLQLASGDNGAVNMPAYAYGSVPPAMLVILANGIGFRVQLAEALGDGGGILVPVHFNGAGFDFGSIYLSGTYSIVIGAWYLHPTLGYQFFTSNPGGPWQSVTSPSLDAAVGALQLQPCPWFIPTYIIRLTDASVYQTFVSTYNLTTPIILGLSPNDAAAIAGTTVNTNSSNASQSVWPQVYVDPSAASVLGTAISLSAGGGTVPITYTTPFGRPCDYSIWKWQALIVYNPSGVTYDSGHPAPAYTTAVVPSGDAVPDGSLLRGGPGYGNGSLAGGAGYVGGGFGPCGCGPGE